MTDSPKKAFAVRLVGVLKEQGMISARNAKSGVDVGPLAKTASVSREMARRYTDGTAVPDLNRMGRIATWLNVRLPWLRDGDGPKRDGEVAGVQEPGAPPYLSPDAIEIAQIWSKLSPARRAAHRNSMAIEAMIATHYPWLTFGNPESESYRDYERRVERDILRIAARLTKT